MQLKWYLITTNVIIHILVYSPHSFHFCYCYPVKSFFLGQQEDAKPSQLGKLIYTGLQVKNTPLEQIFPLVGEIKQEKKSYNPKGSKHLGAVLPLAPPHTKKLWRPKPKSLLKWVFITWRQERKQGARPAAILLGISRPLISGILVTELPFAKYLPNTSTWDEEYCWYFMWKDILIPVPAWLLSSCVAFTLTLN